MVAWAQAGRRLEKVTGNGFTPAEIILLKSWSPWSHRPFCTDPEMMEFQEMGSRMGEVEKTERERSGLELFA